MANFQETRQERERREREMREGAEVNSYLAQCSAVQCGKGSANPIPELIMACVKLVSKLEKSGLLKTYLPCRGFPNSPGRESPTP